MMLSGLTLTDISGQTVSQFISEHGAFKDYLVRMKIIEDSHGCSLCKNPNENAKHLIIDCEGTRNLKASLEISPGIDGRIEIDKTNTQIFIKLCTTIMSRMKQRKAQEKGRVENSTTNTTSIMNITQPNTHNHKQPKITNYFTLNRTKNLPI